MTSVSRRGQCPSLSAPMQTGDGLLVRLHPMHRRVEPSALAKIAAAALRYGNGRLEVTARGNLQIRGLQPDTVEAFAACVDALGIEPAEGIAIEIGALAGLDPAENADPRALAAAIRRRVAASSFADRLSPKVSVVVDGGGALRLDDLDADIRLSADKDGDWHMSLGGNADTALPAGMVAPEAVCAKVLGILASIAAAGPAARARDLYPSPFRDVGRERGPQKDAIGMFALRNGLFARGFGLRFGQVEAETLAVFAEQVAVEAATIHLAPGRALLAVGLTEAAGERLAELASRLGLIVDANDPARSIAACQGAPGCASAQGETLPLAEVLARDAASIFDGSIDVHLSGCGKACAHPAPSALTLVGQPEGYGLVLGGTARSAPSATFARDLAVGFGRLATAIAKARHIDQNSATCLASLGAAGVAALLRGE